MRTVLTASLIVLGFASPVFADAACEAPFMARYEVLAAEKAKWEYNYHTLMDAIDSQRLKLGQNASGRQIIATEEVTLETYHQQILAVNREINKNAEGIFACRGE